MDDFFIGFLGLLRERLGGDIEIGNPKTINRKPYIPHVEGIAFTHEGEPDGFRGIKWNTDIKTIPNIDYVERYPYPGPNKCVIKGERLEIGDAKLKVVNYLFWEDKLYAVGISAPGFQNYTELRKVIFAKYGENKLEVEQNTSCYKWNGDKVTAFLGFREESNEGVLLLGLSNIFKKVNEFKEQKIKKAVETDL